MAVVEEVGDQEPVVSYHVLDATVGVKLSANGKALNGHNAGHAKIVLNEDGTITKSVVGVAHRNAPGEGNVGSVAGREVVVLTLDANERYAGWGCGNYLRHPFV